MELEIIKHKDILFRDVLRAIAIKCVAWPYPIESQIKWVVDHLKDEDEHVFLTNRSKDLAYLNLIRISIMAGGKVFPAFGIGNVCAAEIGKGFGRELMEQVGAYLGATKQCGLLFCRRSLVQFYSLFGWTEVGRETCTGFSLSSDIHVMALLTSEGITHFEYNGELF